MGNLFASLIRATSTMGVIERGFATVQNNVSNASTPGYAKQVQTFVSDPFDPSEGLPGGVQAGPTVSTRDEYAEQAVRTQQQYYGAADQTNTDLTEVQSALPITDGSGIPSALSSLFQSFSALSTTPNDTSARQSVLDNANALAQTFQQTVSQLNDANTSVNGEIQSTVADINQIAGQICELNQQTKQDFQGNSDPSVDASYHNLMEQLSSLGNFTMLHEQDGTWSVMLGGQTTLVQGANQHAISADLANSPALILDDQGADITNQVQSGRLGSLMETKNDTLPSVISNLNDLASGVADTVNEALASGVDENGLAPTKDLFTYDPTYGAAQTLSVTDITPEEIAAATPDAPGGNGNALNIAALANAQQSNGMTFTGAYSAIASSIGNDVSSAQEGSSLHQQLLAQAQSTRDSISGVSLDEEATNLIEFQRSYQATAKLVQVLNEMTQTIIDMMSGT